MSQKEATGSRRILDRMASKFAASCSILDSRIFGSFSLVKRIEGCSLCIGLGFGMMCIGLSRCRRFRKLNFRNNLDGKWPRKCFLVRNILPCKMCSQWLCNYDIHRGRPNTRCCWLRSIPEDRLGCIKRRIRSFLGCIIGSFLVPSKNNSYLGIIRKRFDLGPNINRDCNRCCK